MQTTINSDSGWFRAVLEETEDGIAVAIWHKGAGAEVWKPYHRETVDVPFHVACDLAHEVVNKLRREVVMPSGKTILAGRG